MVRKRTSPIESNVVVNNASTTTKDSPPNKKQATTTSISADNFVNIPTEKELSTGALQCVAILPGIGKYGESSDSDKSTDTDEDYDYSSYDWVGRKIKHDKCQ